MMDHWALIMTCKPAKIRLTALKVRDGVLCALKVFWKLHCSRLASPGMLYITLIDSQSPCIYTPGILRAIESSVCVDYGQCL